jgi:GTP-binding protein
MVTPDLQERGYEVFTVSAVAHQGLKELTFALARLVEQARAEAPTLEPARIVIRPKAVDDTGFTIRREHGPDGDLFRVVGERPTRWVRQTDFSNDEAVGYLADRLNRLGVEDGLFKAGAVAGDTVVIGTTEDAVVFDWEPTLQSGAELLGSRGSDLRFDQSARPTREERREAMKDRYAARAATQAELDEERRSGLWHLSDGDDDSE